MGLVSLEPSSDLYSRSGASNYTLNPPEIHLVLPERELEHSYALYRGTGGNFSSLFSVSLSGANTQIQDALENKLAAAVGEICSAFNLTKEDLAQVCKIQSRKTLYNWINGEATPRRSAMNRVYDLLIIARAWVSSGFIGSRELLFKPVIDDQSVFDLLNKSELDKELILFAGSSLNLMSPVTRDLSDPFV